MIDIRSEEDYEIGHIKGSLNIPLDKLGDITISKEKLIVVYCNKGISSLQAASILKDKDYKVYSLEKGFESWQSTLNN